MTTDERKNFLINLAYFAAWAALTFLVLKYALSLFLPFILGFIVAFILKPSISYISRKLGVKRKYAAFIAIVIFYLCFGLSFFFIGKKIVFEASEFIKQLPQTYENIIAPFFERLSNKISNIFPAFSENSFRLYADGFLRSIGNKATDFLTMAALNVPEIIVSLIFAIVSSVFISADYFKITEFLSLFIPKKYRDNLFVAKDTFVDTMFGMLKGYILIAIITFGELFLGLSLLKVKHALLFSAVVSILDMLPVIGSGIFLIPYGLFHVMSGNLFLGAGILILYAVITVVRNIIEPKIIGSKIGLSPILMLLSIYAGGKLFGFFGIFILPVAVIIGKKLYEIHKSDKNTV